MTDKEKEPTIEQLIAWEANGMCEATDGCVVEPDGTCEHGAISWMRVMEFI
jgi:hypothetical protein